jgi:hypothetical protein
VAGRGDAGVSDGGPDAGDAGSSLQDAGSDAGLEVQLSLVLHRLIGDAGAPDPILAFVTAADESGAPLSGLAIVVDAGGVILPATEDAGFYLATIVPPFTSGELPVTAFAAGTGTTAQQTALVLPFVGDLWDQPQPVVGLVNTPGTEDSSTVSPDGEWLIVGTYSPLDVFCCGVGCGGYPTLDGDNPACVDVLGPVAAPARPGMPGADRISGSRLTDWSDPQMCAVLPDGGPIEVFDDGGFYPLTFPPVAAYGFHRQSDGSYAEPFPIQMSSDGFVGAPFCFTFLGDGDGGVVSVVFAFSIDAVDGGKPHPWVGSIALGQSNTLGSYACESSTLPAYPAFTPGGIQSVPVGPSSQQAGNTSVARVSSGTYLLSDDESASPPYVEYSLISDAGVFSDWVPMALPEPGIDRRQPVVAGPRLFYYRGADVASVAWNGADPGEASSFSDLETELSRETNLTGRVGEVVGLGQPTFAAVDGGVQMFFVYYRRSATGADGQIGNVWLR